MRARGRFGCRRAASRPSAAPPGPTSSLDAALVSRLHCRLEAGLDSLEVFDLESTNGTYVNDKRVDRARLAIGDRLRVGRVELTVERNSS